MDAVGQFSRTWNYLSPSGTVVHDFFQVRKSLCKSFFFFYIKENRTWIAETTFPNGASYMSSFQQFLLSRKPGLCTACDCNY